MTNDEAIYVLKNTAWLGWDKQKEKVTEAVRMAVEALKTQLPKEDTTSDCISRQAAIRWVKTECNPYGKPTLDFESGKRVMEYLKTMPSVQPEERTEERTETHACDCISKQGAIDICNIVIDLWQGQLGEGALVAIKNAINNLPSAQPEPQWGKTVGVGRPLADREIVSRLRDIQKQVGGSYAIDRAIEVIEAVQAQPDIIACGDCKHWICHDRRCGYWNHGVKPLEWCCHAERRTDGTE